MPSPSMGFCSQRFPPPSSRCDFHRTLPPTMCNIRKEYRVVRGFQAPGRSVRNEAVLPGFRWPILSQPFCPFEDFSPRVLASCLHKASSHGLPHNAVPVRRCGRSTKCQRTRGLAWLSTRPASLFGVYVLGAFNRGCWPPDRKSTRLNSSH